MPNGKHFACASYSQYCCGDRLAISSRDGDKSMTEERRSADEVEERELATRMLKIQSKRFYLDVKQNHRGRFIKIAEVGSGGRKSRILMSLMAAGEFRQRLQAIDAFYKQLQPQQEGGASDTENNNAEQNAAHGLLKSDTIYCENRRYFLDLKENKRGRFLRVTQMLLRAGSSRSQVALPAQGIEQLAAVLEELLTTFGTGSEETLLPDGVRIRADNKLFFCDVRQNSRGVFMRVSEVNRNYRSVISVPQKAWVEFRNYFIDVCDDMERLNFAAISDNTGEDASHDSAGNDASESSDHGQMAK